MSANHNMDNVYLQRAVEDRFVNLIRACPDNMQIALDVGCGAGLYGAELARKAKHVFGIDISEQLCRAARKTGFYEKIICDSVANLPKHFQQIDLVLCIEVLEHLDAAQRKHAIACLHTMRPRRLIFTTPNPLSPHYRCDPTHIAKYNIYSMLNELNAGKTHTYQLRALGFADYHLKNSSLCRFFNPLAASMALLSPTVAYIGSLAITQNE